MRRLSRGIPLVILLFLILPLGVHAAGAPLVDPSFSIVPDAHDIDSSCPVGAPLNFGGVLRVIQNLMNAGVSISVFAFVLVLAYAGILFLFSPTNPENRTMAKNVLTNAVVGFIIVLASWLIVDFVMRIVYNPAAVFSGSPIGPWNNILGDGPACVHEQQNQTLFSGTDAGAVPATNSNVGGNGGGTVGSGSGGMCTNTTNASNPCSVQSLSSTCFAASGADAARVCFLESAGGQPAIPSGSDKLNRGAGPSYSIGLWQINLTTSQVGGYNCPAAFSHRCEGQYIHNQGRLGWCDSSIVDQRLYAQCVTAAQNPQMNTQAACSLYNSRLSAWQCSASRCAVAGARVMSGNCAP